MASIIEEFVEDNLRPKAHQLKIAEEAIYYMNTRAEYIHGNTCKHCAVEHLIKNSMEYTGWFCDNKCDFYEPTCQYVNLRVE